MFFLSQLLTATCSALVFWHWVGIDRLTYAFQPLTTAVSILIAAVFVRLNRGLPAIDWGVVSASDRAQLTDALVKISIDYIGVLIFGMLTIAAIVLLGAADQAWLADLPQKSQKSISAVIGFLISILLFRMGYVVWRDLDIVRLQKTIIDRIEVLAQAEASQTELNKQERRDAADKLDAMQRAGLETEATRVTKL